MLYWVEITIPGQNTVRFNKLPEKMYYDMMDNLIIPLASRDIHIIYETGYDGKE